MTDLNGHIPEPPLTEPTPAPEIFVDGMFSVSIVAGVAKMSFFSLEHDATSDVQNRRVVLRLVAPLPVTVGIHAGIGGVLEKVVASANKEAAPDGVANVDEG